MKVSLLCIGWIVVASSAAWAAPEDDFATCVKSTGAAYLAAREKLLAAPPPAIFLDQKQRMGEWDERVMVYILKGWLANQARYKELLAAPHVTDQKGTKQYAWAKDREPIHPADVPLMYEMLIKHAAAGDEWDPALALIRLAERNPNLSLDVLALHQFFQKAAFTNRTQRVAAAWLLGNLPQPVQRDRETYLLQSLQAELSRKDALRAALDPLLLGLARAAQNLNAADRDKLVSDVLQLPTLAQALGETLLTHAVGNIGGDKASQRVAQYLEQTPDEIEKQWALATLSRASSTVATPKLLEYADDKRLALREEAIKGLARVPFTDAVGDKLVALASQEQLPSSTQRRVARTTIAIAEKYKNDPNTRNRAQVLLTTVKAKLKGDELKQELDDAVNDFINK